MSVASLKMSAPAYIAVETPEGQSVNIDMYHARRALAAAQAKPEAERWNEVVAYLQSRIGCTVAENQAIEFNDVVISVCNQLDEDRKKKAASIVSSLTSTPASPETTDLGPTN